MNPDNPKDRKPSKIHMGTCWASGKRMYATRALAKRRARLSKRNRGKKMYSYECADCNHYHLSSKRLPAKVRRRLVSQ